MCAVLIPGAAIVVMPALRDFLWTEPAIGGEGFRRHLRGSAK